MPSFTFTDPQGQSHTMTGPEGSTPQQAFELLQQKLGGGQPAHSEAASGLGSLWERALQHLPPEARKFAEQLRPQWEHNADKPYDPYKPMDAFNPPNDAINPVGTDAQMATALGVAGGGALAARGLAGLGGGGGAATEGAATEGGLAADELPSLSAAREVTHPPVNMGQMPTQTSKGAEWARNMGQAPSSPATATRLGPLPANPVTEAAPLPGTNPAQAALLSAAKHVVPHVISHAVGGPAAPVLGLGIRALMRTLGR